MKKRILSLLLLVAMVVTAMPIVVLPTTAAATTPEWTEEDYDALYAAQEAALISLDFFKSNSYWGEEIILPESPELYENYAYNGTTIDFTDPANRLIPETDLYTIKRTKDNAYYRVEKNGSAGWGSTIYEAFTEAEANEILAKLGEGYTKQLFANWYIVRTKGTATAWLLSDGTTVSTSNVAKLYADKAEATAKAKELAGGEAATDNGNGTYTSADGFLFSVVWHPQINFAYQTARNEYCTQVLQVLYAQNLGSNTVTLSVNLPAIGVRSHQKADGSHSYAPFKMGEGFLELDPHDSNAYLNINGVPATGTIFVDMVVAGGTKNAGGAKNPTTGLYTLTNGGSALALRSSYLRFAVNSEGTTLLGTTGWSGYTTNTGFTQHTVAGRLTPFRITIDSTVKADKTGMTFKTVVDGTTVNDAVIAGTNYTGGLWSHGNTSAALRFYTFRIYNRSLTEAEQAQNHFADLAKWFKLDLTSLQLLSASDMAPVYAAVAAFGFDSDKADVQAAMVDAATKVVQDKFADVNPDYLALAVEYGIDLSPLDIWPVGMLKNTYAFLNGGYRDSNNVRADYEAAVAADVGSTMTPEEYNKLYALDGLVWAADFTATNKYWGNAVSGTYTKANAVTLLNSYRWQGTRSFSNVLFGADGKAAEAQINIKNGALSLASFYYMQVSNIETDVNYGENGVTMQSVRNYTQGGTISHLLGFRMDADASTNAATNVGNGATSKSSGYTSGWLYDANGQFDSLTTVATHTVSLVKPKATNPNNNLTDAEDVYSSFTEEGKGVVVNLDDVVYESKGGAVWSRFYPYERIKPDYIQVNGEIVKNTEGKTYSVVQERFMLGSAAVYENDKVIYKNDTFNYINTPFWDSDTYIVLWGQSGAATPNNAADLYFLRFYNRVLTVEEQAQNHFADVAKYFRLNIAGFETLNAEDRAAIYAAVADINVATSTQAEAQAAVSALLNAKADAAYDAMKEGVTSPEILAFIENAKSYRLAIGTVLESRRNMSSVYALSFDGLSSAEAQALLDEAYLDAYYYRSYMKAEENEWNDLLTWAANNPAMEGTARLNLEGLMALPFDERLGILDEIDELKAAESVAAAQAIVDAYVAVAMADYNAAITDYDYNSIYQQEGLLLAVDFFSTNRYWNTTGETFTAPVGPSENTNYFYDANGNGEEDDGERFDLTDKSVRDAWRVLITYDGKASGFYEEGKDDPWNGLTYAKVTTYYANQADAEAAAATAKTAIDAAIDTAGVSVDKSKLTTTAVLAGSNAFYDAYTKWYNEEDRHYLASYAWKIATGISVFSYAPSLEAGRADYAANAEKCFSVYTHGDGYIQMRTDFHSSGGLQIGNVVRLYGKSDNMSFQTVTAYKKIGVGLSGTPILWHNVRPQYAVVDSEHSRFDKVVTGFAASGFPSSAQIPLGYENVNDITYTMAGGKNNGDTGIFMIRTPGETLVSAAGTYGSLDDTTYFDYNHQAKSMRIYAFREYNTELTDAAILKNHFADIAKFYRLDLGMYDLMSEAIRNEMYAAFAAYTLDGDATRDTLQGLVNRFGAKVYAGKILIEDEAKNSAFLELAAAAMLNLAAIENLEGASRTALVEAFLADFDPAYAINSAVVRYHYDIATYNLGVLTFAGYQVRLDSGSEFANYAGVRAVYDIDMERLEKLCRDNLGKEIGLSVDVIAGGSTVASLDFVYSWNEETCKLVGGGINSATGEEAILATRTVGGEEVTCFYYTVTFKGDSFDKELLEAEYGYQYSINIGTNVYAGEGEDEEDLDIEKSDVFNVTSTTFGNTVSAARVYEYFYSNGYADDAMVSVVHAFLNPQE